MQYMTRQMTALMSIPFGTRYLTKGEEFSASEIDAAYLEKHKLAKAAGDELLPASVAAAFTATPTGKPGRGVLKLTAALARDTTPLPTAAAEQPIAPVEQAQTESKPEPMSIGTSTPSEAVEEAHTSRRAVLDDSAS